MKKNIIHLVSGFVAGFAMCLVTAYFLPEGVQSNDSEHF